MSTARSPLRLRAQVVVCAVLAAAGLGACSSETSGHPHAATPSGGSTPSSGSFPSSSPTPSTGSTPGGTSTPGAGSTATPPGQHALAAMVLRSSDLPTGWTGTAYQPDPSAQTNQAKFAQCTGNRSTEADKVADVHSQDYTSGDASVSSQASSYKSTADIDADRAAITSPKASSCYEQLAREEIGPALPSGSTIDKLDVQITRPAAGDPSNVVGRGEATVTVTVSGQQVTVYTSAVFIAGRLVEAEVDFENVGAPLPADLQAKLVKAVADRVAHG